MKFDNTEYFGQYDQSNIEQIVRYLQKMDSNLGQFYDFGKPFMKGDRNVKYIDYLSERTLNEQSLSADESLKYLSSLFQNLPNWGNPGTMINVIPPVNLISVSASFFATLYSANIAQDTYAGLLVNAELEVAKYISELVGWDWQESYGTFTFGGKGTNLYAAKVALSKANPDIVQNGLGGKEYFMITSANAHPCHYEVCNWIGIGKTNCVEVSCDKDGKMNVTEAERVIRDGIAAGKVFIGFNLNGGSTNELYIDPIKEVAEMNERLAKEFKLEYTPHIHVDAVLSWVYLFFNNYSFDSNPLKIEKSALQKMIDLNGQVQELQYADSIGIDFHKTGFTPYISSMFLTKNRKDFYKTNNTEPIPLKDLYYGNYNPYQSTLELTRSALGPIGALASLKSLGIEGYQKIISDMFVATEQFRSLLSRRKDVSIINPDAVWLATFFVVKPKKYQSLSLDDILLLPDEQIEEIKQYNINYAKFILDKGGRGEVSFTFTASRSYKVPGTEISLGALKVYPMSPFLTVAVVEVIIESVNQSIDEYALRYDESNYVNKVYVSDEMVYREHK